MANKVTIATHVSGVGKASSDLDRLRDRFERLQKQGAKGFAIGAGAAITTAAMGALSSAAGQVIDAIGDSIAKASDLNETLSKSQVVFGASAGKVATFGETAARALGQSKNQAIAAAAEYGNLFKTIGLTESASADMSVALVQLASDLASFNNADPSETLAAIKSGLIGEAEPMRRFGVLLNEAGVKAKAMELGLVDARGELSESAKVQARYALILEQTTTAQGDYARTADGLANVQRTLSATVEDLQTEIGSALLPVMLDLAIFARDDLIPALRSVGETIGPVIDAIGGLGGVLDALPFVGTVRGLEKMADKLDGVSDSVADSARAAEQGAAIWQRHMNPALADVALEAEETGGALRDVAKAAEWAAEKSGSAWESLVPRFEGVKNRLTTLANEAAGAIYDPLIRAAELAANQREQAEQRAIIAQKRGTDESKQDYADRVEDAKLRLLELEKASLVMQAEMAGFGETSAATLSDLITALEAEADRASGEMRSDLEALIAALQRVQLQAGLTASAMSQIGTGVSRTVATPRQHGGPVAAGEPAIVGERGPELWVPRVAGTVIPSDRLAASARALAPLQLTVNVSASPGMTPAAARSLGDAIGPAIYDYLFRRGVLGRT